MEPKTKKNLIMGGVVTTLIIIVLSVLYGSGWKSSGAGASETTTNPAPPSDTIVIEKENPKAKSELIYNQDIVTPYYWSSYVVSLRAHLVENLFGDSKLQGLHIEIDKYENVEDHKCSGDLNYHFKSFYEGTYEGERKLKQVSGLDVRYNYYEVGKMPIGEVLDNIKTNGLLAEFQRQQDHIKFSFAPFNVLLYGDKSLFQEIIDKLKAEQALLGERIDCGNGKCGMMNVVVKEEGDKVSNQKLFYCGTNLVELDSVKVIVAKENGKLTEQGLVDELRKAQVFPFSSYTGNSGDKAKDFDKIKEIGFKAFVMEYKDKFSPKTASILTPDSDEYKLNKEKE